MQLAADYLQMLLRKIDRKLEIGLERALSYGKGIYPTYFTYEAVRYEVIEGKTNPVNGYPNVSVTGFAVKPLPLFLEAPSRMLKTMQDAGKAQKLYDAVKASGIYDRRLKMYKTSEPLEDTSGEVGRLKAFTPGWLEREAIFLHMEYKYLYSILKAGLYEQFYEDAKTMLVPFMVPAVYGRSTLENTSFIASSVNPDEAVHGRGYVARLTGTTAEALSIWFFMMAGNDVFTCRNGELSLELKPILPGWLFDADGRVIFRFLGKTLVTYNNTAELNTYGVNGVKPVKYILSAATGETFEINGPAIRGFHAEAVRAGNIERIVVSLE